MSHIAPMMEGTPATKNCDVNQAASALSVAIASSASSQFPLVPESHRHVCTERNGLACQIAGLAMSPVPSHHHLPDVYLSHLRGSHIKYKWPPRESGRISGAEAVGVEKSISDGCRCIASIGVK